MSINNKNLKFIKSELKIFIDEIDDTLFKKSKNTFLINENLMRILCFCVFEEDEH